MAYFSNEPLPSDSDASKPLGVVGKWALILMACVELAVVACVAIDDAIRAWCPS